jgi:hypothetical protein
MGLRSIMKKATLSKDVINAFGPDASPIVPIGAMNHRNL